MSPMRWCICKGCPACGTGCGALFSLDTTRTQRCPPCQRHRTTQLQHRPSPATRGYDAEYRRNRPQIITQARNGRPCKICGNPITPRQKVTVEHIVPLRRGGTSDLSNLAPAHSSCNTAWNKGKA